MPRLLQLHPDRHTDPAPLADDAECSDAAELFGSVFLASSASGYVRGQVLAVGGGWPAR